MVQPLEKTAEQNLKTLSIDSQHDPAIPLVCMRSKN